MGKAHIRKSRAETGNVFLMRNIGTSVLVIPWDLTKYLKVEDGLADQGKIWGRKEKGKGSIFLRLCTVRPEGQGLHKRGRRKRKRKREEEQKL